MANGTTKRRIVTEGTQITQEVEPFYMGMHKNGQTVSCSTRVVAIKYKTNVNEEDDTDVDLDNDDTDVKLTPNSKLSPEEMTKFAKPKPKLKRLNAAK